MKGGEVKVPIRHISPSQGGGLLALINPLDGCGTVMSLRGFLISSVQSPIWKSLRPS